MLLWLVEDSNFRSGLRGQKSLLQARLSCQSIARRPLLPFPPAPSSLHFSDKWVDVFGINAVLRWFLYRKKIGLGRSCSKEWTYLNLQSGSSNLKFSCEVRHAVHYLCMCVSTEKGPLPTFWSGSRRCPTFFQVPGAREAACRVQGTVIVTVIPHLAVTGHPSIDYCNCPLYLTFYY